MALIKCKECGKEVSSKAGKCPNCGNPISQEISGGKVLGIFLALFLIYIGLSITFDLSSDIIDMAAENNSYSQSVTKVTLEKFNQIQSGMTYEEVVAIIGEEGTILSEVDMNMGLEYKTEVYYWYAVDEISNANITFQGGKVIAKAQVGLE